MSGVQSVSLVPLATEPLPSLAAASTVPDRVPLTVLSYSDFEESSSYTIESLKTAFHEQGIVGIKGIPVFQELVRKFIESARAFSNLPEGVKERYAPKRDRGEFLGYELGAEKFKRPDGTEVVDDSKASYYAFVPDHNANRWPEDTDLKNHFQAIGDLMAQTGKKVMERIGLLGANASVSLAEHQVGRMLHYRMGSQADYWCGAHFDHGLFTALLPAVYFNEGQPVHEPAEAGLFVRGANETVFKKVVSDDPDVMLFQVGEFGQLATNDAIKATEHRVAKASGSLERYTMALFFGPPMNCEIHSSSLLTQDKRYGGGEACSYNHWHTESLARYRAT